MRIIVLILVMVPLYAGTSTINHKETKTKIIEYEFEKINVSVVEDSLTSTNEKYIRSHFTGQDNETFKVYPNPVSDILYLELLETCSVQIQSDWF